MTKARDIADFKFENIVDTGTEGTKVASGTTAQRGSTTGQWRFNSTIGFFEGRNADGTFTTLEPTPKITSVDVTEVDSTAGGNVTFVITGENLSTGGTIAFVGTSAEFNADTSTFNSATQYTAVKTKSSFLNAQEPYKIKFTSATGNSGTSAVGLISVDSSPTWTTNAGNIATIFDAQTGNHVTVAATDAEGDTISYSEINATNLSGAGLSLNSSTGVISGDPNNVSGDTTVSFDLRATANNKNVDRTFNVIIKQSLDGSSTSLRAFSVLDLINANASSGDKYVDIHGTAVLMYYDNTDKFGTGVSGWLRFDSSFMNSNGSNLSAAAYSTGPGNSASWNSGYQGWTLGNHSSHTSSTGIGHVRMKMPRLQYARVTALTGYNSGSQTADDGNVEQDGFYNAVNNTGSYHYEYAINRSPQGANSSGYPISIYNTNQSNSYDMTNRSVNSTGNLIYPYPGGHYGNLGTTTKGQGDFSMTNFSSFDSSGAMWFSSWSGDSGSEQIDYSSFTMWVH